MISSARTFNAALGVAVVGLALCGVGVATGGLDALFPSWLVAAMLFVEIAFGCLAILLLHTLTGGAWGQLARRPLFAGSSTMPVAGALFAPVVVGLKALYLWARPEEVSRDPLLQHKAPWLNAAFWTGRLVFYFALWSAIALFFFARAKRRAAKGGAGPSRAMKVLSGPGLLACALTMTFAAMDWIMSLDPRWVSTLFGLLVIVGSLLAAMAFSIIVVTTDAEDKDALRNQSLHDLGNLLLVFVMIWAYFSFSQYLIIYAGNMAEEVPFYVERTGNGWQGVALALIVLHFCVPFVVLLSRRTKRNPHVLRVVAGGILLMRFVELFWFVAPQFRGHEAAVTVGDVGALLAISGLWVAWLSRRLRAVDAFAPGRGEGVVKKPEPQRYDDREINSKAIIRVAAVITFVTLASVGAAALIANLIAGTSDTYSPPPAIASAAATVPVEPRLQPSPPEGLKAHRAREDAILKTYAWVDPSKGVVRIPIDRAVELLVERGLPARPSAPPASTFSEPTNSSLRVKAAEP